MNARRTAVRLTFAGVDISADINKHLLSLTYTDNEEDKTDDLQLSLDDREGVWLGKWLNTPGASKGVEISAVIVQKNWESNGKDRVLDCGVFEIDTVDGSGPPAKATIKAGSIPYKSTVRTQKKTKAWENYTLSGIAKEIAGKIRVRPSVYPERADTGIGHHLSSTALQGRGNQPESHRKNHRSFRRGGL